MEFHPQKLGFHLQKFIMAVNQRKIYVETRLAGQRKALAERQVGRTWQNQTPYEGISWPMRGIMAGCWLLILLKSIKHAIYIRYGFS